MSWQWRVTQKLKRNWLVVLKLTRTSQILNRALEKYNFFCFNWLLVTKVYIFWATKVQRSYLSWHWGVTQILKKDWPVVWKKTEIWQIFTVALENVKIGTLMGSSCPKEKRYDLKIYRGVMCHDNEVKCKIWRGIDFSFQNWHEEFNKFWLKLSKIAL